MNNLIERLAGMVRYHGEPEPERDWYLLLRVALAFVIAGIAFNGWLFWRVASGETLGNGEPVQAPAAFNVSSLDEINQLFDQRAEEAVRYKTYYPFVDPSR